MLKKVLSLSMITSVILMAATYPIHDTMDNRIKGKSFGGTLDDNVKAVDGMGIIALQRHTGTTHINNELKIQKIFNGLMKGPAAENLKDDVRTNLYNGTIGTVELKNLVDNYSDTGYLQGTLASCSAIKTAFPTSTTGTYKLNTGSAVTCDMTSTGVEIYTPGSMTSCLEIKTAYPSSGNGVYKSLAGMDVYCDMSEGWTLLLNHDMADGYFASKAEGSSYNVDNPTASKYSILNKISSFKKDGKFTFKLYYPGLGGANIWSQTSDPSSYKSTTSPVPGYTPISIAYSGNKWGGLEFNPDYGRAYIDGSVNSVDWWFALGATPSWSTGTTFPGPNGISVSEVQLWVK